VHGITEIADTVAFGVLEPGHKVAAPGYLSILTFVDARRDLAKDRPAKQGCRLSDQEMLSALMLNLAADANPKALALFSSRCPVRAGKILRLIWNGFFIRANRRRAGEPRATADCCPVERLIIMPADGSLLHGRGDARRQIQDCPTTESRDRGCRLMLKSLCVYAHSVIID